MTETEGPGRRERNKADKRRRIEEAARRLFSSRGYSEVTTQEVARLADVGTGTLFRYAQSKGELLCLVANAEFRDSLALDPSSGDLVDDLTSLCEPLLAAIIRQPENAVAYHRETIFGEPGPHRDEAMRILERFRRAVAAVLARESGREEVDVGVDDAAQTVFDVIYMELVRGGVHPRPERDLREDLRGHLRRVAAGALVELRQAG